MPLRPTLWLGLLLALCSVLGAAPTPPATPRLAQETSDVPADPTVLFGRLPNGVTYAIKANAEPRSRVSLRLLVLAGAYHEKEEQRGLAHFLEHMAFNGSTHYPPGTLIEYFQRLGMGFGNDTNAHTAFDHTAYQIELPDTRPETVREGLQVLADYSSGMLLLPAEIERERGVILAEKRDRNTADYRQLVAQLEQVYAGTLVPNRLPIGTDEVISGATREQFLDFYQTWYRPERLAVVLVGDLPPSEAQAAIERAFSELKAQGPARPDPALGERQLHPAPTAFTHYEPEAGSVRLTLTLAQPARERNDTLAQRQQDLRRAWVVAMINRRLEKLGRAPNAPFTVASLSWDEAFDTWPELQMTLLVRPEQWKEGLKVAENELRRALQYGFTPAELDEARANLRTQLQEAVKRAPTRRSPELADELQDSLLRGQVFTSPEYDLSSLTPALDQTTGEQLLTDLREATVGTAPRIGLVGNLRLSENPREAEAAVLAAFAEAAAGEVAAPAAEALRPFAYTHFGEAGSIAIRRHLQDLDLELATLTNGVRLNLKKTDFEKDKIRFRLRVGAGQLTQPWTQPGLNLLVDYAFFQGGLGQHSFDDLQRLMAGRTVQLAFQAGDDAIEISGETNREDLLFGLQLATAYLVDPGYRPEAVSQLRKLIVHYYTQLQHRPEAAEAIHIPRLLASGDPRLGLPLQSEALQRNLDELRAWLTPQFTTGPLELSLIGDLDLDAARQAALATVGALPKRQTKPAYTEARRLTLAEPTRRTYSFVSDQPKALVKVLWLTTDQREIATSRQLRLLADIVGDRLRNRLREELGDAYSPRAVSDTSDTYHGFGTLSAIATVDVKQADLVTEVILKIGDELAAQGVTEDELERARRPLLTALRENQRRNEFWLQAVLGAAQEQPQRLEWQRSREAGFQAITKADLDAVAKRFLAPGRAFRFQALPGTQATPEPTPVPPPVRPSTGKAQPTPTPIPDF